uniref:ABC transporter ATP-binding protein n=1 Tax=Yoonia sp. TaxID=2212373 RepID=UPI003F6ED280
AITGESGSGKSLTALAIMGLLPQGAKQQGQILLDGTDIVQTPEPALCRMRGNAMGMVFQEPMTALNPVQTIGAQVAETIRVHENVTKAEAHARAAAMLDRVGLKVAPTRYPHELSGGQRQRVVIAMAIAMRPKLLIADEPTTALDVTTQARILDLLQGLVDEFGMGLLLITHDLAVVADVADRIAVMQHGRIVEHGPTSDLLCTMRHPYTRALFAASTHAVDLPAVQNDAPLLAVRHVMRDYPTKRLSLFGSRPTFRALDDVSLTINRGERVGLVGESGCGKSTLTRAILGLEPVQGGQITLDGAPVLHGELALRRKMQVVFQDPYGSFNPRHRVDRLITEPFHLLDNPPKGAARDKAIAKALTDVGLPSDAADKYIHEFSGGQRQRLAIARALIVEPDLIIFDEAVSALDVSVRAQVLDLIADICRKRPLAYLFISHDLSVVRSITDRVLVMQGGKIVESGLTESVFADPQHPYTKSLIAAAPQLPELAHAADTL